MRLLFVADLHYSLKQFDWVTTHAPNYDLVAIGGDLLDLETLQARWMSLEGEVVRSLNAPDSAAAGAGGC